MHVARGEAAGAHLARVTLVRHKLLRSGEQTARDGVSGLQQHSNAAGLRARRGGERGCVGSEAVGLRAVTREEQREPSGQWQAPCLTAMHRNRWKGKSAPIADAPCITCRNNKQSNQCTISCTTLPAHAPAANPASWAGRRRRASSRRRCRRCRSCQYSGSRGGGRGPAPCGARLRAVKTNRGADKQAAAWSAVHMTSQPDSISRVVRFTEQNDT